MSENALCVQPVSATPLVVYRLTMPSWERRRSTLPRLVGELNLEPGQIDLSLLARRGLEPHLKRAMGSGLMSRTARFTAV
jgi:hypothetical protein